VAQLAQEDVTTVTQPRLFAMRKTHLKAAHGHLLVPLKVVAPQMILSQAVKLSTVANGLPMVQRVTIQNVVIALLSSPVKPMKRVVSGSELVVMSQLQHALLKRRTLIVVLSTVAHGQILNLVKADVRVTAQ
jgi:hypothetical protein